MISEEVEELIGKENMEKFHNWMYGQTVGLTEDGKLDYYKWDVDKFCYKLNIRHTPKECILCGSKKLIEYDDIGEGRYCRECFDKEMKNWEEES